MKIEGDLGEITSNDQVNIPDIAEITSLDHLKYLGVAVHLYQNVKGKKFIAIINRSLGQLRWKLCKLILDINDTITCALARCMRDYNTSPMVAAGKWNMKDINPIEAHIFRQFNSLFNEISNKAIMIMDYSIWNSKNAETLA